MCIWPSYGLIVSVSLLDNVVACLDVNVSDPMY